MKIRDLIGKKIAVICSSAIEAIQVVNRLHDAGIGWIGGANRKTTHWDEDAEGMGYDLMNRLVISYAPLYHYVDNDFTLVTAKEFIDSNSFIVNIPDTEFDIH
jgi:hypothetical protein